MNRTNLSATQKCRRNTVYALLILPAIGLGVAAMIHGGISPVQWAQQVGAWLLFAMLVRPLQRALEHIPGWALCLLLLAFLAASLLGTETDGVRRWLKLAVFNINTAMLALPALLVTLYSVKHPHPVLMGAAVVLCFQPDVSQLTAFSAAVLPLLWQHRNKPFWTAASILLLAASITRCLLFPARVEPVTYCEGILSMLGECSPMLLPVGILSLVMIPAFFAFRFYRLRQPHLLSLAAYYAAALLFILTGEYPVLFMGFGLSPVVGYFLACSCIAQDGRTTSAP